MQTYLNRITLSTILLLSFAFGACNPDPDVKEEADVEVNPKIEKLTIPTDFVVEHIYSPSDSNNGSWVSMTFDDKGRMIASDQYGGLHRLEIPAIGSDSLQPTVERLLIPREDGAPLDTSKHEVGMGYAQGLL